MSGMTLLPCKKGGVCQECAVDHRPEEPHNQQSLYYQYKFYGEHGRWPTWKDAIAHCNEVTQVMWEKELKRRGYWSEPVFVPEHAGEP